LRSTCVWVYRHLTLTWRADRHEKRGAQWAIEREPLAARAGW